MSLGAPGKLSDFVCRVREEEFKIPDVALKETDRQQILFQQFFYSELYARNTMLRAFDTSPTLEDIDACVISSNSFLYSVSSIDAYLPVSKHVCSLVLSNCSMPLFVILILFILAFLNIIAVRFQMG